MNAEELKSKCIEDLTREYKKAIEERDEAREDAKVTESRLDDTALVVLDRGVTIRRLSEQYAKAIKDLNELLGGARALNDRLQADYYAALRLSEQYRHFLGAVAKHKEKE